MSPKIDMRADRSRSDFDPPSAGPPSAHARGAALKKTDPRARLHELGLVQPVVEPHALAPERGSIFGGGLFLAAAERAGSEREGAAFFFFV